MIPMVQRCGKFVKGQDYKVFNYVGHEKKSYKGQVHIGCIGFVGLIKGPVIRRPSGTFLVLVLFN